MFRIPSFYQETVTFDNALKTIQSFGRGDVLEGMEAMNRVWDEHCASQTAYFNNETDEMMFADDDEFFDHYGAECNAFNAVFSNMETLFV